MSLLFLSPSLPSLRTRLPYHLFRSERYSASGATHILTSQQLSGSKTHKLLTQKKMRVRPHVVRPEWVFDSLDRGRRVPEREYSVLKNEGNRGLDEMFGVGKRTEKGGGSR